MRRNFQLISIKFTSTPKHKLICKFDISFREMFYANNIHLFVSRERSTVEKTIVTDTPATLALRPNYKVTISYPFVLINCHGKQRSANMHTLGNFYSLNDCGV